MYRYSLGLMAATLLVACSPSPRGPVEVIEKTFTDASQPLEFKFTSKEAGTLKNYERDKDGDFKYQLAGDELTITIPKGNGGKDYTIKLTREGQGFVGDEYRLSERTKDDDARFAAFREQGKKKEEQEKRMSPKGAPNDPNSFSSYKQVGDSNNDWATWVAVSWNAEAQKEDTRMGLFSRAWNGTQDSFARKEIKDRELPQINKKLEETRKLEFVAVSDEDKTGQGVTVHVQPYDFEKKGFPLLGGGCPNSASYGVASGAAYNIQPAEGDKSFCVLPVSDEVLARRIEELRIKGSLQIITTLYTKIAGVDGRNHITLVPIGADYTARKNPYGNPVNPEDTITRVTYWPYK